MLQLKWTPPEETGGEVIREYVLEMQPPPVGWEQPATDAVSGCGGCACRVLVGPVALPTLYDVLSIGGLLLAGIVAIML